MQVFVKVAERGSFARAAKQLGLSAQMVGRHIQSLEERLGVPLIQRSTRRQSLTDEGAVFLERCQHILAEVEAAESGAAATRNKPSGRLRLNAPVTFGTSCLAPALPVFLRAHTEIAVELTLSNRNVDLVEEGYDVVLRVGELADTSLSARALAPYRLVLCASPDYLAEHGSPRRLDDLAVHNCLGFSGQERSIWRFEDLDGGAVAQRVGGSFAANNGEALRRAAVAGLGIVMQPEVLLAEDLVAGRLVPVLPELTPRPLPLHLLFVTSRRATPKLRSFIDFMVERFGKRLSGA